jgi:hypothetical protein
MARFHYSELNSEYEPNVLGHWAQAGCFPEMARRLGYRLRLVKADLPEIAALGGRIKGSLSLVNDGFAAPYNPRPVELVLMGRSGKAYRIPLKADPRRWMPGENVEVDFDEALPAGLPAASYYYFLNFPDPAPALSARPEYSIRLADLGLWQPQSGFNWLKTYVTVR